jgi:steroid 5-alpha reductase family enzyme
VRFAWPWLLMLAASCATMAAVWSARRRAGRADHVDAWWAFLVGACAVALIVMTGAAPSARAWLSGGLCAAWSLRLGFMLVRRMRTLPEDGRYVAMKKEWGARAWTRFFWFFQIQAAWVVLFATPAAVAALREGPLDGWDALGVAIALVAVAGEAVADLQLHRFRARGDTAGLVCDQGLWAWSRHPNYFFEWCHWFAYVAIAARPPFVWIALLGPLVMFAFLFRLTGVPWTERQALRSRGDAYRRYQERTSVFFPWPPRRVAGRAS